MNDNVYYGPSSVIPAGYTAPVEQKTGGHKKFIIIAIVLFVLATVGIIVAASIENGSGSTDSSDDAEQVEYDISNESTGGEELYLPNDQRLDFLKEQNITDYDIAIIQAKIDETVDKYYRSRGFNYVYYDLSSVKKNASRGELSFVYKVDTDSSMQYLVTLELKYNNQVKDVRISQRKSDN